MRDVRHARPVQSPHPWRDAPGAVTAPLEGNDAHLDRLWTMSTEDSVDFVWMRQIPSYSCWCRGRITCAPARTVRFCGP